MEQKEQYAALKMEIIQFETEDVITTSTTFDPESPFMP